MPDVTGWDERRAQALRDLIELERQREVGELDDATADRLRSGYLAEAAAAEEALSGIVAAEVVSEQEEASNETALSRQTLMRGTGLTVGAGLALAAAIFFIVELPDNSTQPTTTQVAQQDLSSLSVDELEQIVADFPEVVHTRLALARRYFLDNDYQAAFPHYLQVIDRDPNNADALSDLGWMVFVSGDAGTASSLLGQALAAAPGDPQATLYLAVVRMRGLDDPDGALALLDELTEAGEIPEDLLPQVESLREEARAGT